MDTKTLNNFIAGIPKAELHLHIEGTFEPELMFEIAARNNISLKYKSVEELKNAYNFNNLQEFLDIYYEGASVLLHEQDFYDLTWAYLEKIHKQNVLHTEIFFDPQTHTHRGVSLETVVNGIRKALADAQANYGISWCLIPNFLRHLDESDAINTFKELLNFRQLFTGFGLDSSEVGNPPAKFEKVFKMVRDEGFLTVAHAGEEGPAEYVRNSLDLLKVARIDHGIRSIDDAKLVSELILKKIPLTICPLSNIKLKAVKSMEEHPLKQLLNQGVLATVNSDDPAYFGGYLTENYEAAAKGLGLTTEEIVQLAKNSFSASFIEEVRKNECISEIEDYYLKYG